MVNGDIFVGCNEFLTYRKEYNDPVKVAKAKTWYLNFTGKKYENDDIKELVEIYNIIQKNS